MKLLDQALKAYGGRDIYAPERARATFKRSKVLRLLDRDNEANENSEISCKLLRDIGGLQVKAMQDLDDSVFSTLR